MTYLLMLNNDDKLVWCTADNGGIFTSSQAPETTQWKRFMPTIYGVFPESEL